MLDNVRTYYTARLLEHGATPRGVDWNSAESQELRFEQLLKVCDLSGPRSILDYGCGYGALLRYLRSRGCVVEYQGFDISQAMLDSAIALSGDSRECVFVGSESLLKTADYVLASGVFNVKLQANDEQWSASMLETLGKFAALGRKGFAFNVLTKYSDPERMRPDLYYADPGFLFDYCKRNFSRNVAVLHDYGMYEFTVLVRQLQR